MRAEEAIKVVLRPHVTEKTFDLIERQNKLVFIVDSKAKKSTIKEAIKALYDVEVESVNTVKTAIGKKAYVKFRKERAASDLASKLGLV